MPAALSILLAVAALVAAIGALAKKDRTWVAWTALVAAGLPLAFWIWFVIAEILAPHA